MFKLLIFIINIILSGCAASIDDGTLIADDNGLMHKTIHYSKDQRGKKQFPRNILASNQRQIIFDPKIFAWAAYDESGNRIMTGAASGGNDFCPEDPSKSCRTKSGIFKIYQKKDHDCRSNEYPVETDGGGKMPYCMYFYRGHTIHGAFYVPFANTSHGCIRVYPSAAKWLNEEFITPGTKVIVLPYDE